MPMPRWKISKEQLVSEYATRTLSQIARIHSVDASTVWKALKHHRIPSHSKSEGAKINWEKAHNKPVPKGYLIHHLNGIRNDNRPENLAILPSKQAHSTWTITSLLEKRIRELEPAVIKEITGNPQRKVAKGRYLDSEGYVRIHLPLHPRAYNQGYVLEHIVNWERANNQQVPKGAIIHHLNGIRDDNRPENLAMLPSLHEHKAWTIVNLQRKRIHELEEKRRFG